MSTVDLYVPGADDTAPVVVAVNDLVIVHLQDQSAGTGYQWSVIASDTETPAVAEPAGDSVIPSASGAIGGAGEHVFRFRAVRSGDEVLRFALRRSWETTPLRVVDVDLTVRD
jgi:predicted secreted protein